MPVGKYPHKKGDKSPRWKGGKIIDKDGYFRLRNKEGRYVLEHRLIMEGYLDRLLLPTEVVHHINGDKQDNRIENLQLLSCKGEHTKITNIPRDKNGRFVK